MKNNLEYKDEKSAKFWKIEVIDTSYVVTYGKIGTEGQSKTTTLASVDEATEKAEKLVTAKLRKGYIEANVQIKKTPSINPRYIADPTVIETFNLSQYAPLESMSFETILLIEGDLLLDQELNEDFIKAYIFDPKQKAEQEIIVITGNLTIKGDLRIYGETGYPSLLILGNIHCDTLYSFDNFMHIAGDAFVKNAYLGSYNHGAIKIAGTTHAPYIVNDDHHSDLVPSKESIVINSFGRHDDFFEYDYYRDELPRILIQEASGFEVGDAIEEYEFDFFRFIKILEQGKFPFKEEAKPGREIIIDELKQMADANTTKELDLTDKRLREIPPVLFQLTNLEILTIAEDHISSLPKELGQLIHLKALHFKKIFIETIPESISQLKELEVLTLSHCHNLTKLPECIGQLENLKILNLAHCYKLEKLPESIGQLKNLEKIVLWYFKGDVPDSIFELPQIDQLEILI